MGDQEAKLRKVAVVTGAAKRIGACIVRRLHKSGFNVLVHYHSSEAAAWQLVEELNQQCEDSALCEEAELQNEESSDQLIGAAVKQWGRVDLLVNNASAFYPTKVGSIDAANFAELFNVNVRAPLLLTQAGLPQLTEHKGSVININDIYSAKAHKDHAVYCASQAALSMLTKSLALDLAPAVRVNGVSPGAVLWPEGDGTISEAKKQEVIDEIPLDRMGTPDDIAAAVLYLVNAQYITGHTLTVDGGRTV